MSKSRSRGKRADAKRDHAMSRTCPFCWARPYERCTNGVINSVTGEERRVPTDRTHPIRSTG